MDTNTSNTSGVENSTMQQQTDSDKIWSQLSSMNSALQSFMSNVDQKFKDLETKNSKANDEPTPSTSNQQNTITHNVMIHNTQDELSLRPKYSTKYAFGFDEKMFAKTSAPTIPRYIVDYLAPIVKDALHKEKPILAQFAIESEETNICSIKTCGPFNKDEACGTPMIGILHRDREQKTDILRGHFCGLCKEIFGSINPHTIFNCYLLQFSFWKREEPGSEKAVPDDQKAIHMSIDNTRTYGIKNPPERQQSQTQFGEPAITSPFNRLGPRSQELECPFPRREHNRGRPYATRGSFAPPPRGVRPRAPRGGFNARREDPINPFRGPPYQHEEEIEYDEIVGESYEEPTRGPSNYGYPFGYR